MYIDFDLKNFKTNKDIVFCSNHKDSDMFRKFLHNSGRKYSSGKSYELVDWFPVGEGTGLLYFGDGTVDSGGIENLSYSEIHSKTFHRFSSFATIRDPKIKIKDLFEDS